jgi:carbonic anhydrase
VDGRWFPLEMHLVHEDETGGLAVVGVLFEEGAANHAFDGLVEDLPAAAGQESYRAGVMFDPADLLPSDRAYYEYDGSLTTPPCSEGVAWRVLASPVQLSRDQIDAMSAILMSNNRPIQPVGDRQVRLIR